MKALKYEVAYHEALILLPNKSPCTAKVTQMLL
jgi:hypothetical protein